MSDLRNGEYYAKGVDVWRAPKETETENGKSVSMGFHVCECSPYIQGAAEEIALALNALPLVRKLIDVDTVSVVGDIVKDAIKLGVKP